MPSFQYPSNNCAVQKLIFPKIINIIAYSKEKCAETSLIFTCRTLRVIKMFIQTKFEIGLALIKNLFE